MKIEISATRLLAIIGMIIILVALIFGLAGCGTSTVTVEKVQEKELPIAIQADANVAALNKATIQPEVGGQVAQFTVKVGDTVQAGQVVAILDTSSLQAQLSSLQAKLNEAQTSSYSTTTTTPAAVSSGQLAQAQSMLSAGIITQKEYDRIASRASAQTTTVASSDGASNIAGIEAAMSKIQADLANAQIKSPIAGVVTTIYNEDRKVAIQGRPFMLISQATPVVASLSLPQAVAKVLATPEAKQTIKVHLVVGDTTIPGELTYVDTSAADGTPAVLVKATFDNSQGLIKTGEFYPLFIGSDAVAPILSIPEQAIHENDDGKFVYVVTKDNTVDVRVVSLGEATNGYAPVLSGISEGEVVITSSGTYELGQSVKVKE